MAASKYTFWNLIEKYPVEIPMIQRDYAQGRKLEKVNEIRKNLVNDLYQIIENQTNLDLDFVYGSIQSNCFIPLDGQQRLTTLFLLHWYLATKEGAIEDSSIKERLSRFTYKTRSSSNEFCADLIAKGVVLDARALSDNIKDAAWFFQSWEKDPTVQSMLVMLDAIQETFEDSIAFFERLISKNLVTFQFIELDNFGLSDGLYIKMNARGKALTDFENFKAKFEQFLEKNYPHRKNEFIYKIDGVWTDLFWTFKEEYVIDKPFMRYFEFITEMLHYIGSDELYDEKIILDSKFKVYVKEQNIDFLFKSLDKFFFIAKKESIASFFRTLFESVPLFEQNTNLFIRCIQGKEFDIKEKILLFSIIEYLLKIEVSEVTNALKDCIRVIRNLILRVRAQDGIKFKSDL
ncbi:MAG: hypothetical protein RLZZ628_3649, partial [Bacteroidota bacterium]